MTSDISPQAIISLSYDDWEEFVEALDIKKPAIVHDEELRRAIRAKTWLVIQRAGQWTGDDDDNVISTLQASPMILFAKLQKVWT